MTNEDVLHDEEHVEVTLTAGTGTIEASLRFDFKIEYSRIDNFFYDSRSYTMVLR